MNTTVTICLIIICACTLVNVTVITWRLWKERRDEPRETRKHLKRSDAIAVQISEAFPRRKVRAGCERSYFNPRDDVTIYIKVDNIGACVTAPKDCDEISEVASWIVNLVKEKMNEL